MLHFDKKTVLPASVAQAFAWHSRPGAFERLSPPWQRLEMVQSAESLDNGTRVIFRLHQGPVSLRWIAEHRHVRPPHQFEDVQIEGPFASWTHTHSFEPSTGSTAQAQGDGTCLLHDSIDYALPLSLLSETLGGWKARRELERLFTYRHRTTVEDLQMHRDFADRPRLRIAITGASGLVGSALSAVLTTGGHEVIHLVRREPQEAGEVLWEPSSGVPNPEELEGIDALISLAGENIASGRWTAERKRRLVRSRVEATRALISSLGQLESPPGTFLSASAVGYYGDRGEKILDEQASPGDGFLADLTQKWEAATLDAEDLGARVVSMRFGVVLSPKGGALAKMLPAFRLGAGGPLGTGEQYMAWISLDDAVGAIYHALMTPELQGPVNTCAPEPTQQGRFASVLGKVLHRPAKVPMPKLALKALFGEMARETLLASTRAVPQKLQESGYSFRHPDLKDALEHMLGRSR